jgi:cyclophilin family peptidyl-prolyl cis-trans isomerase
MRQKLLLLGVVAVLIGLVGVSPLSRLVAAKTGETKLLVVLALDPDPTAPVAPDALLQAAQTVERRAQALAGANAEVWTSGETRIVVELPGFSESDHDRVADLLTSNSLLELIDPQGEFLPSGTIVVTNLGGPADGATPAAATVYTTIVSGSDVSFATNEMDQFGQPTVRFQLTDEAAARFFAYTSEHLNLPLSIVIDKTVISSPIINAPISGDGIIAGLTEDEVNSLVLQFNTGELAVPLKVESSLLLSGLPGDEIATPASAGTPVAVADCWTPDQVISTDPPQWSVAPGYILDSSTHYTASVTTNLGTFTIELFPADAPNTVNNFVCLARAGYYDGSPFHRILAGFVIQGGDPTGTGRGGPGYRFDDEPARRDYELGTVAMANAGPNTNGSQFFVVVGPQGQQLPNLYTIFGQVSEGMDVVQRIAAVPVDVNERGEPSHPIDPVIVESVTISES